MNQQTIQIQGEMMHPQLIEKAQASKEYATDEEEMAKDTKWITNNK